MTAFHKQRVQAALRWIYSTTLSVGCVAGSINDVIDLLARIFG